MPSIIFDTKIKKKFEGIRGKFLSTELFEDITRAEALELMIDILNYIANTDNPFYSVVQPFNPKFIEEILKKRKENVYSKNPTN